MKTLWTITQKWENIDVTTFQNESVREIMSVWVTNDRTIWKEVPKIDQWNFLICLCDNYFGSFLTVLRDLTSITISNLMNNKRAYFNLKWNFPKVQTMNTYYNIPFDLSVKLHKIAKYFNCGTKIWDKIINYKYYIQN